MNEAVQYETGL